MKISKTREIDALREAIDITDDCEIACLSFALLVGNGGELEEPELYRQATAVRNVIMEARFWAGVWDNVLAGKIALAVRPDGEIEIMAKEAVSLAVIRQAKMREGLLH